MNLLICGFSGAGKSTLGSRLTGVKTVDLDQELVRHQGKSVNDLVKDLGWDGFRDAEFKQLMDLILGHVNENLIISLGGGALNPEKLKVLRQCLWVKILWLNVPFEVCWDRIKVDPERPLVKLGKEALEKLYNERMLTYEMADFCVSSVDEGEKLIAKLVK